MYFKVISGWPINEVIIFWVTWLKWKSKNTKNTSLSTNGTRFLFSNINKTNILSHVLMENNSLLRLQLKPVCDWQARFNRMPNSLCVSPTCPRQSPRTIIHLKNESRWTTGRQVMWRTLKGIPKGEWVVITPEWHMGEKRSWDRREVEGCQVDIMRLRHVPLQLLELFTHTTMSRVATTVWLKRKTNCTLHFSSLRPPSPCCCTDWHYVNVGLWKKKSIDKQLESWHGEDKTTSFTKRLHNPGSEVSSRCASGI